MRHIRTPGLIIFLLSMHLPVESVSRESRIQFEQISLQAGLSQAAVFAIARDDPGFMWFGTLDGLNCYDGYQMQVFRHDPEDSASLAQNKITVLHVDRHGILWIGTAEGGLDRLDRQTGRFIHYQHKPGDSSGISDNHVRAIHEDRSGALWIATHSHILDRFDRDKETFTHFRIPGADNADTPGGVTAVFEDTTGRDPVFWLGTFSAGLKKFTPRSGELRVYRHDPEDINSLSNDNIRAVHGSYDSTGLVLWIGTAGGGLNRLHPGDNRFSAYQFDRTDKAGISSNTIYAVRPAAGRRRMLWLATENGLNRFDTRTGRATRYQHTAADPHSLANDRVRTVLEDGVGNLWVGTLGGGISKYSREKVKFRHYRQEPYRANSINDNFVRSILTDRRGNLWIGTATGGANLVIRSPAGGAAEPETAGQRVFHFTRNQNRFRRLSHNSVRALHQDSRGNIWLGTDGGLDMLPAGFSGDPAKTGVRHFRHNPANPNSLSSDRVWVIIGDKSGPGSALWLGTYGGGLNRLLPQSGDARNARPGKVTFERFNHDPEDAGSLGNDALLALHQDRSGVLWIGTNGGLDAFDPAAAKRRFLHYRHDPGDPGSLSNNTVTVIHEDRAGMLWIGTYGGGLNKFDRRRGRFTRFTEKEGLPNNIVSGILEEDRGGSEQAGHLWISTYNGLTRFDPGSGKFEDFDISDGLQSMEFGYGAYHQSVDGEMFFGGVNGFNAFYPDSIGKNPHRPPVVITSFSVFGEQVRLAQSLIHLPEIELTYDRNHFSFEFAALDYAAPEKNRYAYRLEGVDREWIYCGNRRYANYNNVEPGVYQFRVKGSNNDGLWNEQGVVIRVVITPPFWETRIFRILAAALVAGLLFMLHRYRLARAVEMEQLRIRIAGDLHDDIGSSLTKIAVHSEIIQATDRLEKIKASSRKIGAISREIVTTLSDIVWAIDARNDSLGDLLDRLRSFAVNVLSPREIRVSFTGEGLNEAEKLPVDVRQHIYLIGKEAINNIARHAGASLVRVHIAGNERLLKMIIADNGCGLPDKSRLSGNGLRNMQTRAERLGGDLQFINREGLTVQLTVKIK